MQTQAVGLASFLSQTDGVGKTILVLLLLMSMATWVLIVSKVIQFVMTRRRCRPWASILTSTIRWSHFRI